MRRHRHHHPHRHQPHVTPHAAGDAPAPGGEGEGPGGRGRTVLPPPSPRGPRLRRARCQQPCVRPPPLVLPPHRARSGAGGPRRPPQRERLPHLPAPAARHIQRRCHSDAPRCPRSPGPPPTAFPPPGSPNLSAGEDGWEMGTPGLAVPVPRLQTRGLCSVPTSGPTPPPQETAPEVPEGRGEGVPPSQQMAAAPSLPPAALLVPGGTAFSLPGPQGAEGTAQS